MKIVHITVVRCLTPGQIKQLSYEHAASKQLDEGSWTTLAYHTGPDTEPFIRTIPWPFGLLFVRNLYGWIVAYRLSNSFDLVLMRHMTFDLFSPICSPFLRNRVSVHHAKEIEELRLVRDDWKGKAASLVERVTGRVSVRNAVGILGVTREIAEYERDLHSPRKPIGVYSNGIDPEQVTILDDMRQTSSIEAAFICGSFAEWHGLEKLIDAVDAHQPAVGELSLKTHLIGSLSDNQKEAVLASEKRRNAFRIHGVMSAEKYRRILARCDFGLTSFALEKKGLEEASTLKVREMLAAGLAVYSGHKDIALPSDAAYVMVTQKVTIDEMLKFGKRTKLVSREHVREGSLGAIDKCGAMKRVLKLAPHFMSLVSESAEIRKGWLWSKTRSKAGGRKNKNRHKEGRTNDSRMQEER